VNVIDRHSAFSLPSLNGERKLVTVLFADIVRSAELVAGHDPEDANDHLLPVLQAMIDAVHRFGGTVNQILGDGVMAVFGAPVAQEDHAVRACLTAQAMQAMASHALRNSASNAVRDHRIRVGISSGEVVAQTLQGDLHSEYRVVGETVYRAARLESAAAPGSILLCRNTLALSRGAIDAEAVPAVSLSDQSRKVEALRLIAVVASKNLANHAAEAGAPAIVGRAGDLDHLNELLGLAESGMGASVVVTGEAGIGKSRLVREFIDGLADNRCRIVECDLHPTGLARPSGTIGRVLRGVLGPDADNKSALTSRLEQIDLGEGALRLALFEALGFTVDDLTWSECAPAEKLRLMVDAATRVVLAIAQTKAVIVVLEDVHWSDSQTRAFAAELSGRVAQAPVMLLATSRMWTEPVWETWPGVVERRLDPLAPDQTARLLNQMLGVRKDLDGLKARLVDMTQGVPFFIVECVRSLKETNALEGRFGSYRLLVSTTEIRIPATVHGLLAARIDTLPPTDRYVLLCASVVGQRFDVGLLQEITGRTSQDILMQLSRLQAAGFVSRTRIVPNLEFSFQHALIHDVAYKTLLKGMRRDLHGSLMKALRHRRPEQLPGRIELLAHHAYQAQDWAKAAVFCRLAGLAMLSGSRNAEAVACFGQGLESLSKLEPTRRHQQRLVDYCIGLVEAEFPLGHHDEAAQIIERASVVAEALNDQRRIGRVASQKALVHWAKGDVPRAIRSGKSALSVARKLGDLDLEIQNAGRLGALFIDRGDFEAACSLLERAVRLLPEEMNHRRFGLLNVASVGNRAALSRSLAELGRFRDAIRVGDEAIRIADEVGHTFSRIYANLWVGDVLLKKGDFQRSIPLLETCVLLCETSGSDLLYPRSAGSLGYAYVRGGRWVEGIALLEQAIQNADRQAIKWNYAQQIAWLAEARLVNGDTASALEHATNALQTAVQYGEKALEAWSLFILGDVTNALETRPDPVAHRYLTKAWDMAKAHRMSPLAAHCHRALGTFYLHHDAPVKARKEIDLAIGQYREMGMDHWLHIALSDASWAGDLKKHRVH
jgi:class 3 adenylate cyclase/tetratricopeptide (TPR) repeat protein